MKKDNHIIINENKLINNVETDYDGESWIGELKRAYIEDDYLYVVTNSGYDQYIGVGFGELTIRAYLYDLNKSSFGFNKFEYYSVDRDYAISTIKVESGLNPFTEKHTEFDDFDEDQVIDFLNDYRKDYICCRVRDIDKCIFDLTNLYDIFDELYTLEWTEFDKNYQENSIECNFVVDDLDITIQIGFDSNKFVYYSQCALETDNRSYDNTDKYSNIIDLANSTIEDLNVIRRLSKNEEVLDLLSKMTTILSKYNN